MLWLSTHFIPLAIGLLVAIPPSAALSFFFIRRYEQNAQALAQQLELNQQRLSYETEKSSGYLSELNQLKQDQQQLANQLSQEKSDKAALTAQLQQLPVVTQQLKDKEQGYLELQERYQQQETRMAELETQMKAQTEYHAEQVKLLNENKEQLKQEFSHLANEIFEQSNKKFQQQSSQSMSALLDPFQKNIDQFRQRVDAIHSKEMEGRGQLVAQLNMLKDMNNQLNQQATDLTKALKGDKKLQGNWGELQIERILESSGLQKGREYEREANFKDDDGKNLRPDFIIRLPEGKHIVIDSKVSLVAYQESLATDDDVLRQKFLLDHVAATRNHIRSLSDKNYPNLNGMNAPDFVLMFMPIESAFIAAFETDQQLFNEAFERHIVVVTPTTLLATLKTVANLWVLERQNENAKELFKLAGKIYDKLAVFGQRMDKLGSQLKTADNTWQDAMGSLRDGRGSMASYVQRLQTLGAATSKQLPASMSAESLDLDDPETEDNIEDSNKE
ncbi:DNA recombination protein RmuC [Reinekea thalattae]|uniref:DNA recombination protein RmuC n=1 Tax=Reinekea thalattae TaxID=2593301 RepID=A0A5C8ZBE6_9GAMM|nr:DNA recombination protein RmuC [Reinekea thalattae]TXR54609.1 DNA recombination protein RmuC [Reinekea thalattae]